MKSCRGRPSLKVEPWFSATMPTVGPRVDLQLLKDIVAYSAISKQVSSIACSAYLNHLWYLSPHCVALAFFDRDVSVSTKTKMVQNLSKVPSTKTAPKRAELGKDSIAGAVLEDFRLTRHFSTCLPLMRCTSLTTSLNGLTSDYNCGLTQSEKSFQDLLLVGCLFFSNGKRSHHRSKQTKLCIDPGKLKASHPAQSVIILRRRRINPDS
ncbi:Aspartyl/glutamyl-tRNA(Asn/Gln) amidotransferase subunit B [Frankliniella fusca]|uniref:Aspartyl/glutamyl-tRNA(Asn/Gln) amidotransferase subunit B n=1 Tax=Frankliniella fusca TaxID=407009 RepID=A0AAE1GX43_9NEOP|nr:Aspartyl/glutamyl-tRNA(Asn/Gln) amidotransferase subunit B [Frankliniella fusca]